MFIDRNQLFQSKHTETVVILSNLKATFGVLLLRTQLLSYLKFQNLGLYKHLLGHIELNDDFSTIDS